jgi:hypothetical protein
MEMVVRTVVAGEGMGLKPVPTTAKGSVFFHLFLFDGFCILNPWVLK